MSVLDVSCVSYSGEFVDVWICSRTVVNLSTERCLQFARAAQCPAAAVAEDAGTRSRAHIGDAANIA
jgi:hypothetical protein